MNAKSLLKVTTANVSAPKATKVEDNGAPISNRVVTEIEQRKSAAVIAKASAKGEIAGLVNGVTSEVVVSDNAGGRARAMAIVTLCLMHRHSLVTAPTKRNLSNNDGDKDFAGYLAKAFAACDMDYAELIKKSDGVDNTWREALAAFTWLNKVKCLVLDATGDNGKYAHLGMLEDQSTKLWKLALDINTMAAAGVEIDGVKVTPDGGFRRATAAEVIKLGQALLQSDDYWKKSATTALDVIAKFAAYCVAIAGGSKPEDGPTLSNATLNRLREVAVSLASAIEAGEAVVADNAKKAAAMKAEAEKTSEQKAADKNAPARETAKAKRDAAKAAKAEAKKAAKVTYLKSRKAKKVVSTAKRKAA